MKTLIVYNNLEEELKYAIVDGDYSNINGAIINSIFSGDKEIIATDLLFDTNDKFKIKLSDDIKFIRDKEWDEVAVVTFIS